MMKSTMPRNRIASPLLCGVVLLAGVACGRDEPIEIPREIEVESVASKPGGKQTPEIEFLRVTPSFPIPGDQVRAQFESKGSGDMKFAYTWHLRGKLLEGDGPVATIPEDARKGDVIRVRVRAHANGRTGKASSATMIVSNSPVEWVGLELVPSGEVRRGTRLVARAEARDHDGDDIEYRYRWWLNGSRHKTEGTTFETATLRRGDTIEVRAEASDQDSTAESIEAVSAVIANSDPTIVSAPVDTSPDGLFQYDLQVEDPDGDRRFVYSLNLHPKGMSIDRYSGRISWRPNHEAVGAHEIEVRVVDRFGGEALQQFEITVGQAHDEEPTSPAAPDEP
jgi:hypothetical protein